MRVRVRGDLAAEMEWCDYEVIVFDGDPMQEAYNPPLTEAEQGPEMRDHFGEPCPGPHYPAKIVIPGGSRR